MPCSTHDGACTCAKSCHSSHLEYRVAVAGNLLEGGPLPGVRLQAGRPDALQGCAGHALLVARVHAR